MTRLARATAGGHTWLGRIEGDEFLPLVEQPAWPGADPLRLALDRGTDLRTAPPVAAPLADYRLLAPVINPQKVLAIGLNYADHVKESGGETPKAPILFVKTTNSIVGPGEDVVITRGTTEKLDWEVELAAVIGRRARHVTEADALDYVIGYTVCNDLSARDAQFGDGQWVRGKSFDGLCPLGPWIVTSDEISDPQSLALTCEVNGVSMQSSSTKEMIFGVAALVSYLSQVMTLEPGDVIPTGTPPGVGFARNPSIYLQDGDTVDCWVDGIGTLTNRIVFA